MHLVLRHLQLSNDSVLLSHQNRDSMHSLKQYLEVNDSKHMRSLSIEN